MFIVEANANKAWCTQRELLTTGSVGQTVELHFDESWDGLAKFALFRAHDVSYVDLIENDTVPIPQNVLERPNVNLLFGVYGANEAGTIIIPTVYTDLGAIRKGAEIYDADNAAVPTDAGPFYERLAALVADASAAAVAADAAAKRIEEGGEFIGTVAFSINASGHLIETITADGTSTAIDLGKVVGEDGQDGQDGADGADGEDADVEAIAAATQTAQLALQTAESAQTAAALKQTKAWTTSATLQASQQSWTVTINNLNASDAVIVTPAPASFSAWVAAGVYCYSQSTNQLVFKSAAAPTSNVTANILVLPGVGA